jgi:uncharacterized protein
MGMIKSKLKRRLRKKFHVGEFQELGFEIKVSLKSELSEVDSDKFYVDFILQAVEKNQLMFGGGGDSKSVEGFITSSKKYTSATENQKEQVRNWLKQRDEVFEFQIGDLKDGWND